MSTSEKDLFSSKWGFILAAAGSAIGMGNIWLFPYRVAENGGFAFLFAYVVCAFGLGLIALIGELALGRLTGKGPLGAFRKALRLSGGHNKMGEFIGWVPILVIIIIGLGYTVVVSWTLRFLVGAITGSAFTAFASDQHFDLITRTNASLWIIVTLVISGFTIVGGIEKGIEKVNKIMMTAFLALFLMLAIRVAFLSGSMEGYKFLFSLKWKSLFNARTWILALGQSFYSLSTFGSIMLVYGSYARKKEDIIYSSKSVVILSTLASVVASMVIIPAVFSFGKALDSGTSLMFITMPDIFKTMPLGKVCMVVFFTAVFFAANTSLISILEVAIESLQNKLKMSRFSSVALAVVVVSIFSILTNGHIDEFMDMLQIHFIPFCALLSAVFTFWIVPSKRVIDELQKGRSKKVSKWIIPMGRYVFCSFVIVIYVLNVLHIM
ncbi:MAG: sodium-dependent transporter [Endomicrobium sp.]|jgi:NSS family neurotransmitter:Na+ symporter|nr:sodium-dependent transporter [Endomicrobium sp.]